MSARRTLWLVTATVFGLVSAGRLSAQDGPKSAAAKPAKTLDASYVSDDFFAALAIQPARLVGSPAFKGQPVAEFAKAMKEQLGVEPQQIEQVLLLMPRDLTGGRAVRGGDGPPRPLLAFAGIVRFREEVVNKELIARAAKALGGGELEQVERAGKSYWRATGGVDMAAYAPDERTLVFAPERRLLSMAFSLAPGGRFVSLLKKTDASPEVVVVVEPAAIREAMAASGEFGGEFTHGPEALLGGVVLQVLRRVESYTFSADFSAGSRLRWEIVATSPDDAELLHDLIRGWQATLKLALPAILREMSDPHTAGFEAELQAISSRVLTEIVSGLKTSRTDDRVVMQLESKGGQVELLTLAAKALATARLEGPIVQSTNNLKQLGLGMHNYHDTHLGLPPHANYAKETMRDKEGKPVGKPLLSWRVHLLPYMEGVALHGEFHFDEPWDSEHNKKLIAKMPAVFKSPGLDLGEGKTCYVVPVGNDAKYATMFPPGPDARNQRDRGAVGLGLATIPDGTSNTLMILEVPADKAVIWTKPDDWEVNIKEPKKGLFGARQGFLLSCLGDGSVQRVSEKASGESLLRLFGRQDGEVINHAEVFLRQRAAFHDHHHDHDIETRPPTTKVAPFRKVKKADFEERGKLEERGNPDETFPKPNDRFPAPKGLPPGLGAPGAARPRSLSDPTA